MEVDYLDLVREGYMGSIQWQLGREMGTIPLFASRTQENQENLCRGGRSQDLLDYQLKLWKLRILRIPG
jgi:hypothetical protein